ncbi:MAG: adenylate/guanylate cyclase domain-containing protein [Caldimonas sp.]
MIAGCENVSIGDAVEYPTGEETSPSLAAVIAAADVAEFPFRGQTSPDGTMTVVFTDLEGSTEMLERLDEQRWVEVIRDHNRLVRGRVSAHDGVVVKSQGDGFMIVFASASAALACAVELQQLFSIYSARHPDRQLRARIGLHTGNVFQEKDDFLGKTVVVAARITGRARGGEVLVSDALKDYTERVGGWRFGPPADLSLKGLTSTQRVHPVHWRTVETE